MIMYLLIGVLVVALRWMYVIKTTSNIKLPYIEKGNILKGIAEWSLVPLASMLVILIWPIYVIRTIIYVITKIIKKKGLF